MKKLIVIFLLVAPLKLFSQEITYGQYMFQSLYYNPAFAGNKEKINIQAIARQQWTGIAGAPFSYSSSIDAPLGRSKSSLGIEGHHAGHGDFRTNKVMANYAYRLAFNKSKLSLGLGMGYGISNVDFKNFENDPVRNNFAASEGFLDAKAGIHFSTSSFYFALSAVNLLDQELIASQGRTFVGSTGLQFKITDNSLLYPSILISMEPNANTSFLANTNLKLRDLIWLGLGYKQSMPPSANTEDGLVQRNVMAQISLEINNQIRVGYNYEQPISQSAQLGLQSHEISLNVLLQHKKYPQITNPRYL